MNGFNMQPAHTPGSPFSLDLVCGMKVDANQPPARWVYQSQEYHFCCEACRQLFQRDPEKYTQVEVQQG
jgi:YHS domain-containing protein